jgi:hypothetical protein
VRDAVLRHSSSGSLEIPMVGPVASGAWGEGNAQTDALLEVLQLPHIWTRPCTVPPDIRPRDESLLAAESPKPPPPPPPSWLEQVQEGLTASMGGESI